MAKGGRGRRGGTDAARFLVALVGALEKPGDTLRVKSIAERLSISEEDARRYLTIIQQAYVDDGQYLPVFVEDDCITLQYAFGFTGRPIRLTSSEASALIAAMETADVPDDSSIRKVVEDSFVRPTMDIDEVERTLSSAYDAAEGPLGLCAQALVDGARVSFSYKDASGAHEKRLVDPRFVHQDEGLWYLDGYDVNRGADRTFRVDRMSDIVQAGTAEEHPAPKARRRMVELRFSDPKYLTLLDWPYAQQLSSDDPLVIRLPYYETDWLVRRIAACAGSVKSSDDELNARVVEYAKGLLG